MDKKETMTKNDNIKEIVNELQKLQLELSVYVHSCNDLQRAFSDSINHLITNNFARLIFILYRLDISEKKLKQLLVDATNTAGDVIAKMIIERQLQKIEARKSYSGNNLFCDEEKW